MIGSGPDGVLRLCAGDREVALWKDHTYSRNSTDNVHAYDHEVVFAQTRRDWTAFGIRVTRDGTEMGSAVLLLPLGSGEPEPGRIAVRPDTLYLPAQNELAALDLASLRVRWETESDLCGIQCIHELPGQDSLIVHGELSIARVEPDGTMTWGQAGRDIFSGESRIVGDAVEVTDWHGELYRFRLSDGEMLAGPSPPPPGVVPPARPAGWMERLRAWLGG